MTMTESWYAEYAFRSGTVFVQDVSKEEPELVADDIRSEEDARLIAAAPDLYEACRALLRQTKALSRVVDSDQRKALIKAQEALNKAEGQ